MAAERIDVLARAMCEAYARNSGNNFAEHFNTRAATIWMRQALEEAGVAELIEIQRRIVAWNRNVNGEGSELARICADAEAGLCRAGGVK